jgi:hypothetical protein
MGDADLASGRTGAEGGAAGAATKPAPTGGASGGSMVMVTDDGPGPEPPIFIPRAWEPPQQVCGDGLGPKRGHQFLDLLLGSPLVGSFGCRLSLSAGAS